MSSAREKEICDLRPTRFALLHPALCPYLPFISLTGFHRRQGFLKQQYAPAVFVGETFTCSSPTIRYVVHALFVFPHCFHTQISATLTTQPVPRYWVLLPQASTLSLTNWVTPAWLSTKQGFLSLIPTFSHTSPLLHLYCYLRFPTCVKPTNSVAPNYYSRLGNVGSAVV